MQDNSKCGKDVTGDLNVQTGSLGGEAGTRVFRSESPDRLARLCEADRICRPEDSQSASGRRPLGPLAITRLTWVQRRIDDTHFRTRAGPDAGRDEDLFLEKGGNQRLSATGA